MNDVIRNITKLIDNDTMLFVMGDHGMSEVSFFILLKINKLINLIRMETMEEHLKMKHQQFYLHIIKMDLINIENSIHS